MEYLKRMLGIVAGLFVTLIVAGLCSFCFNIDLRWYSALAKPSYLLGGGWMTLFVAISYASSILAIGRLVEHKHLFPSMLFFALLGAFAILFVLCFFTLKNLAAALAFCTLTLVMSFILFVRFSIKDFKIALAYLPALLFNIYAFMCVIFIALKN